MQDDSIDNSIYVDNNTGVTEGKLCNECLQDSNCRDKRCPVYEYRRTDAK